MDASTLRFDLLGTALTERGAIYRLCEIVNALELRIAALEAANAALTAALDATFTTEKPCEACDGTGIGVWDNDTLSPIMCGYCDGTGRQASHLEEAVS